MMRYSTGFKFILAMCGMLALAACGKKNVGAGLQPATPPLSTANSTAPGSEQDFITNVGDRIYFIVDQSNLTPDAQQILGKQAAWLQQYPNVTIQVEGHSDERGTREYNIALSARRATAAREFLIRQGIPAKRISSIAYGKERPAALCDEEQCWAQNRRAVTVITGGAN